MEKIETGDVYRSIDELTLNEEARTLANKLLQCSFVNDVKPGKGEEFIR